jgi:hypothetical protein
MVTDKKGSRRGAKRTRDLDSLANQPDIFQAVYRSRPMSLSSAGSNYEIRIVEHSSATKLKFLAGDLVIRLQSVIGSCSDAIAIDLANLL